MYPRYFTVPRAQQAYLTFLCESYEGICSLSTVDTGQGIVRMSAQEGPTSDLDDLVLALIRETGMQEVAWPVSS